jgi:hypothetical protein
MKRKVNVDREKISSEEISSRKNFKSLIKNYPSVTNPFRKTSWRTKGILWILILCAVLLYLVLKEEGCS